MGQSQYLGTDVLLYSAPFGLLRWHKEVRTIHKSPGCGPGHQDHSNPSISCYNTNKGSPCTRDYTADIKLAQLSLIPPSLQMLFRDYVSHAMVGGWMEGTKPHPAGIWFLRLEQRILKVQHAVGSLLLFIPLAGWPGGYVVLSSHLLLSNVLGSGQYLFYSRSLSYSPLTPL